MPKSQHPAFDAFVETIATLRGPDGCPWNRAQTHESLEEYLIEEAYEAADAIESGDPDHIREELGDVLLQVVLQSQVAADAGHFTIDDVCATIDEKMIRRHPHVFGDANAQNA
ncbi:MAG: nucleoside triphosphate pyrophosphohydrolase, partial [Eggerthellaceae bacterium]|nr:nucleoside triphosphate pyrophosphohydrolase [Eggerthellaceae bacterium]